MRAAEVCHPRNHHTRVGDRLLKRREMNAGIAGRVMRKGRQRLAIGLRDVFFREPLVARLVSTPGSQRP